MIVIRPITKKDTEAFINIAFTAGIGMTSMPKNREILEKRVQDAVASFAKTTASPNDETYLFVLEDTKTGEIGGTCGIVAKTGKHSPLSFYRIQKEEQHTGIGSSTHFVPILNVIHYRNYWSEVCSLYLTAHFRHSGLGKLLSLSRFLFIASFPERFDSKIFAEMRGYFDENRISPFWEGVGRHFVDTTFETLMHYRDEGIIDLSQALPRYPIYIELLPEKVQAAIGKVHDNTQAALKMLLQEGFALSDEIDICDGGPKIEAEIKEIRSVKQSIVAQIGAITDEAMSSPTLLLANHQLDFRACLSPVATMSSGKVVIPAEAAAALEVKIGDRIRFV